MSGKIQIDIKGSHVSLSSEGTTVLKDAAWQDAMVLLGKHVNDSSMKNDATMQKMRYFLEKSELVNHPNGNNMVLLPYGFVQFVREIEEGSLTPPLEHAKPGGAGNRPA